MSEIIPTGRDTVWRIKDSQFSHWRHQLKPGTDWHTALQREYWHTCAYKFRSGAVGSGRNGRLRAS